MLSVALVCMGRRKDGDFHGRNRVFLHRDKFSLNQAHALIAW